MIDFDAWFRKVADSPETKPHEWQRALAATDIEPRSRLIRIPTGMGKTLGVLAAWTWHRLHRQDDAWPRRLIWCLPMRVLVEQTDAVIRKAFDRLGVLWDDSSDHSEKVGVHLLMGGADPGGDWHLFPEECAVLIGTQDMLISRALNRGYAAGRARWPLEFGLLSHDTLWVMDEVQLMDVGLATSAQLQAYHDQDAHKGIRPRRTWWMSATLQPEWLRSVDTDSRLDEWIHDPCTVPPDQRSACLGARGKSLSTERIAEAKSFASAHSTSTNDSRMESTAASLWSSAIRLVAPARPSTRSGRLLPLRRSSWCTAGFAPSSVLAGERTSSSAKRVSAEQIA